MQQSALQLDKPTPSHRDSKGRFRPTVRPKLLETTARLRAELNAGKTRVRSYRRVRERVQEVGLGL